MLVLHVMVVCFAQKMAGYRRLDPLNQREKGRALRKCSRRDPDGVFSIQRQRTVDNDNTVATGARYWHLTKHRSGARSASVR